MRRIAPAEKMKIESEICDFEEKKKKKVKDESWVDAMKVRKQTRFSCAT